MRTDIERDEGLERCVHGRCRIDPCIGCGRGYVDLELVGPFVVPAADDVTVTVTGEVQQPTIGGVPVPLDVPVQLGPNGRPRRAPVGGYESSGEPVGVLPRVRPGPGPGGVRPRG